MKPTLFLGIGGSGMKGLAYLLEHTGTSVIGFDDNTVHTRCSLEEALAALNDVDRLIYTDAAPAEHPIRVAAQNKGVLQMPYQEALGQFASSYQTIAITGTHGKSSTTAFLSHIAITAGIDPTVLVGAHMPNLAGGHAQVGKSTYFIVEADEYRRHFLHLHPTHIVITSIDFDHPDAFSSLQDTEHAYSEFIAQRTPGGRVIVPSHERDTHPAISWPSDTISVSSSDGIQVPLPGDHMRMNAALAVEAAAGIGIEREVAIAALQSFPGLVRRFELLGTYEGIDVRSDYGHHPTEIAATLKGSRDAYPEGSILAIFEAHMPLRLTTFFDEFTHALSCASRVLIVPPFVPAGRDAESATQDALRLRDTLEHNGIPTTYISDMSQLSSAITAHTQKDNSLRVAIGFSAGKLDSVLRETVKKS